MRNVLGRFKRSYLGSTKRNIKMITKEKEEDLVGKWMWQMILNQAKEMEKKHVQDIVKPK